MALLRIFCFVCIGTALTAAALGCSAKTAPLSSSDASAPRLDASTARVACDPLARREMKLTNVLGVAMDAQGTYYVADQPAGAYEPRVFISLDGTLYNRHVAGSGSNGSGYTLSYDDADALGIPEHALLINVSGAKATAMALAPAGSRIFIGDASANYESIDLVDASAIGSMKVMGLPHRVNALAPVDGAQMLVTEPIAGSTQDGRAFYGSQEAMNECDGVKITIGGAMSAPTTIVVCTMGSQTKQLELRSGTKFPPPMDASAATNDPTQPTLDGYAFYCWQ